MKQYALQGLHDWNENTEEGVKQRAANCLNNKILSSEWELHTEIKSPRLAKFFPMPKVGYGRDVEHCFFRPKLYQAGGVENWSFVLFVLVQERKCLAFRFEPAGRDGSRHDYAHMQFCRNIIGEDLLISGMPDWIPERDPAFPLPSSNPTKLFLSMAIAVHGRSGGVDRVIVEVFQKASQVNVSKKYITLLREMFDEGLRDAGDE